MTAQSDPYVRVYYRVLEDPKFVDVFDDDRAFAWWTRLLLFADMAYPAPANLPRRLPNAVRDKLAKAELIDLLPSDRYRVHGLSAEREHRSEIGRRNATARWSHSNGKANPMLSEPNLSEPNRALHSNGSKEPDPRIAEYRLRAMDQTIPVEERVAAKMEADRLETQSVH